MSNRPLRLHELLTAYLDNPLVINWQSASEDQKQCVVVRRFSHGGTEYRPNLSPIKREIVSFDQGVAKMFLKQGFIEVKSCLFDRGEATLTERHRKEKVPAFRPWLVNPGEVYPRDDPFIAAELHKYIQVIPGIGGELLPGDRFVTAYSVLRGLSFAVEGLAENERAPITILQL